MENSVDPVASWSESALFSQRDISWFTLLRVINKWRTITINEIFSHLIKHLNIYIYITGDWSIQAWLYGGKWNKLSHYNKTGKSEYSKTCVKRPLSKRPKIVFKTNYHLMQVKSIAECSKGQKYCRMLPLEHSATLLTCIRLPFVIKTFCFVYFWVAALHRYGSHLSAQQSGSSNASLVLGFVKIVLSLLFIQVGHCQKE